ncbi:MAG: HAMP domain-containing sensor histidine kinase [Microgenomates group bacterium]
MRQIVYRLSTFLGLFIFERMSSSSLVFLKGSKPEMIHEFENSKNLAHACATPLTIIKHCLEHTLQDLKVDDQKVLLQKSLCAVQRMELLIHEVLGTKDKSYQPVEIKELCLQAISLVDAETTKKITFVSSYERETRVFANPMVLSEAIICLLNNALEASNNQKIVLHSSVIDRYVRLDITDFGQGMNRWQAEKITNIVPSNKKAGHGIGIPFVQKVLKNIGGNMEILSKTGVGTWVSIKLPLLT